MKPLLFFSVLAFIIVCACKPTANTIPPLKGAIDVADAKRLIRKFGNEYYPPKKGYKNAVDTFPDSMDTRCVWFSLTQLKNFIATMEREKGKGKDSVDGIRFYFATYDSQAVVKYKIKPEYDTYATLLMVSTKYDSVKVCNKWKYIHLDYINLNDKSILTATPENQGELCPPPGNCDGIGATLFRP